MRTMSIIIILDGISLIYNWAFYSNSNYITLIFGIVLACIGISILTKQKHVYYPIITIYSIRILLYVYSLFNLIIKHRFVFAPFFLICITIIYCIAIITYFRNRKLEFK